MAESSSAHLRDGWPTSAFPTGRWLSACCARAASARSSSRFSISPLPRQSDEVYLLILLQITDEAKKLRTDWVVHFAYRGLAWFGIEAGQGKPEGTDRASSISIPRADIKLSTSCVVRAVRSASFDLYSGVSSILMSIKSMEVQSSLNVSRLSMMRKPS